MRQSGCCQDSSCRVFPNRSFVSSPRVVWRTDLPGVRLVLAPDHRATRTTQKPTLPHSLVTSDRVPRNVEDFAAGCGLLVIGHGSRCRVACCRLSLACSQGILPLPGLSDERLDGKRRAPQPSALLLKFVGWSVLFGTVLVLVFSQLIHYAAAGSGR